LNYARALFVFVKAITIKNQALLQNNQSKQN